MSQPHEQLKYFEAAQRAASDMTQSFTSAAWYAHRNTYYTIQGLASSQTMAQWSQEQCKLHIDAALSISYIITRAFI